MISSTHCPTNTAIRKGLEMQHRRCFETARRAFRPFQDGMTKEHNAWTQLNPISLSVV
jgi:hypothetical protein